MIYSVGDNLFLPVFGKVSPITDILKVHPDIVAALFYPVAVGIQGWDKPYLSRIDGTGTIGGKIIKLSGDAEIGTVLIEIGTTDVESGAVKTHSGADYTEIGEYRIWSTGDRKESAASLYSDPLIRNHFPVFLSPFFLLSGMINC